MSVSEPSPRVAVATPAPSGTAAGVALILSSLVAILAIAHHPTAGHRHGADLLALIVRERSAGETVHAVVLAATAGLLYGLVVLAMRLGLVRQTVIAGLVAYALGTVVVLFAGLLDGFAIGSIATAYAGQGDAAVASAMPLLTLCAILIQVCTKFWLFATSLAIVLWSFALVRRRGATRVIAIVGFLAGALVVAATLATAEITPHSLGAVVLAHAIWYVGAGVQMLRGEL